MTITKLHVRPTHDRVAVEVNEQLDRTPGGIIIPDSAKEKPIQGTVIATGPGAFDNSGKRMPMDVKIGDRVVFGKWSGTEIEVGGKKLLVMKESDIMAVVD